MSVIDMTPFIAAKSDQLNADDLMGGPRTITITRVTASPEGSEQPVSVFFAGDDGKPFRPCKTARRIMVAIWGADANQYVGRSMTIYRDADVTFGGMKVGGIRISHMSHMDRETMVAVMKSKGKKAPTIIKPLVVEQRQEQPQQTGRQKAEAWANDYIGAVKQAASVSDLAEMQQKAMRTLEKLADAHPDLAELVQNAKTQKLASFQTFEAADDAAEFGDAA